MVGQTRIGERMEETRKEGNEDHTNESMLTLCVMTFRPAIHFQYEATCQAEHENQSEVDGYFGVIQLAHCQVSDSLNRTGGMSLKTVQNCISPGEQNTGAANDDCQSCEWKSLSFDVGG